MSTTNTQVHFTKIPMTFPQPGEHMKVVKSEIDLNASLPKGDFIVKTLVLSVDPYMRNRMNGPEIQSYIPGFELNKPMAGHVIAKVIKTNNPEFKEGDFVFGLGNFEEYTHVPADANGFVVRNEARDSGLPLSYFLGILALPGLTAYAGLFEIGKPKKGETLFVSAASGAVGQLVGQLGKNFGLRVVGSAGSDDKVEYLKSIGFDAAFNYKTTDMDAALTKTCPDGIDIYFENVGGKTLEIVIEHMNTFGRIPVCGMISQYNRQQPECIHNLLQVVNKRLDMHGFLVFDQMNLEPVFMKEVMASLKEGKLKYRDTISEGIESAPQALLDVLQGKNFGKQIVKVDRSL
ncbi:hypothetical protein BGW37DRAFT_519166 [Umbelopsis sp. PMI_123]|nr:hypothetical protein BGW37DRAFT_519166 [Umbelopsis sp. PMI_123]